MTEDNSTGKNKDFYELGKKMFDRLNPQIAHNPEVIGYVAPQRQWVGLTGEDFSAIKFPAEMRFPAEFRAGARWAEAKLKEKNFD